MSSGAHEPIRMFDYLGQYGQLRDEILAAISRVLDSGQVVLGPEVAAFEASFADYLCNASACNVECVGVNSGTDGLAIALRAFGIGAGDEVITVANTAVPTVSAICQVAATPVFCDVDEDTCLMDLDDAASRVGDRTKAIVPVHLFGNAVDVPRLRELIGDKRVVILEDCAQAHGARFGEDMVGTLGDAAAFSFYPTKNLGAYGDGGLCCASATELVARMRSIRMYGFEDRYYSEREGVNSRLDELQAAVLRVKLAHLADWIAGRRQLAARYDRQLSESVERVVPNEGAQHAYHLYVVKVTDRDRIRQELEGEGVATGIHYPFPVHLMRGYEFLGGRRGDLPVTESLANRILSLPMYPELPESSVDRVCEVLNRAAQ